LKELRIYHGSGHALFADPSRLARLGGWLFVADTDNNRVGICNTNLEDTVTYFTGGGTAAGLLSKPEGVAVDPVRKRLIVADTGNNRILILSANEATGALTYVSQVADPGDRSVFYAPAGVAVFPPSGYLYVADTGNHRIQVFTAAGEYLTAMYGTGFDNPKGVALDADGLVYVADTGHHRLVCMNGAGTTRWTVGGLGDANSKFNGLRDVNFGVKGRIYVADTGNNRIQVFEPQVFGAPTFVASYGPAVASQTSLQLPRAVLPATDDNTAFVADTVNNRVLRMRVIFDLDRDGMDDQWEDLVGLDPTNPNDARVDLDGDLIWNIGEYRLRTNPRLADTDGNGATDGWEVGNGFDPTATGMDLLLIRVFSGAQGNVGWNSVSGRVYRVEYATDLARGNWRLGTVVTSRTDGVVSWSHSVPPGERQRYYRIREVR
jgi:sugar lactone lactonase YvrE